MPNQSEIILKGRLNGSQKNRLAKLLDMMYRPNELAEEVGFEVRQIWRVYIPLGLPHERNTQGHIFIHGETFADWVTELYKPHKLKAGEMFCRPCNKPVRMIDPVQHENDKMIYLLAQCEVCGRTSSRIVKQKRRGYDRSA